MEKRTVEEGTEEYAFHDMELRLGPPPSSGGSDGGSGPETADSNRPTDFSMAPILEVGEHFATRLQLLWTYVTQIEAAAQSTSFANMASLVALFDGITESAKGRDPEDAISMFEFTLRFRRASGERRIEALSFKAPLFEERHDKTIRERAQYHGAALRILNETAVQQLVNAFEQLLADLLRRHIASDISAAAGECSITYRQLLHFQSLEEAKRHVIESQVTEFLRGSDTPQQFKYFRDHLKINIKARYPDLDEYSELVLRRHAIVHAAGVATSDYIRKLRPLSVGRPLPKVGSALAPSPRYVQRCWDTVYSLGVVTFHLLAQTLARRGGDNEAEDDADNWLNSTAMWAIEKGRYVAAERILQYANSQRLSRETCQLMVQVNLAQTYKWSGKQKECYELLDARDWDAANSLFRLCVATLRGWNVEAVMIQAAKEGLLSINDLYDWPVFQELRKQSAFSELLQKAFGSAEYRRETFPAVLLDLSGSGRLEAIVQHLQRKRVKVAGPTEIEPAEPMASESDTIGDGQPSSG